MMKRYIISVIIAAMAGLLCTSCFKTSINSSKIIGKWKVTKMEWIYKDVTISEPFNDDVAVTVEFEADGTVTYVSEGGKKSTHTGSWTIDGDNLDVTFSANTQNFFTGHYTISTIESKSMRLAFFYKDIGLLGLFLERE